MSSMSFFDTFSGPFLVTSTIAMPQNLNQDGDVFGGWILSLMDMASVLACAKVCDHRVVTRAVSDISFDSPIKLGDHVSVYAEVTKIGNTSISIKISVYSKSRTEVDKRAVSGLFTMVAIDENRKPISIEQEMMPINSNACKL